SEPDESYHGLTYAKDLGADGPLGANVSFVLTARLQLLRDPGSAISPFNAFVIAQRLETLSRRIERHLQNTAYVGDFLQPRRGLPPGCERFLRVEGSPTTTACPRVSDFTVQRIPDRPGP